MVRTRADGDCALDVMCLMRWLPRTSANRKQIRYDCNLFARKHVGNRAFISMLHTLGEMTENLGIWELASSVALLMEGPLEQLVPAINHGDGVGFDVPAEIAHPPARDYSPE